jgi:hypothetical protein
MPQAGNGSPRDDAPTAPPLPRRPIPETAAERMRQVQAAAERGPDIVQKREVDPAIAFMARIENAAELLTDIGAELGTVGQDDAAALRNFANTLQQNVQRFVSQMIERKRRELADLERVLGKF